MLMMTIQYLKINGHLIKIHEKIMVHASESHTNHSLKINMAFAKFLGPDISFYNVKRKRK